MLEERLREIVQEGLPRIQQDDLDNLIDHLVSRRVGVTSVEDLTEVTLEMLTPILSPIQANKLLRVFQNVNKENNPPPAPQTFANENRSYRTLANENRSVEQQERGFSFNIPWTSIDKTVLDKVVANEATKKRVDPKTEQEFKLAIVKKLTSAYSTYKESHLGCQKCPGIKVYKSVVAQVFTKFPHSFQDIVNGTKVGDGTSSFLKSVLICTENMMRDKNRKEPATAVTTKGIVGIIPSEYRPHLRADQKEVQEKIRESLQDIHSFDPDNWSWDEIKSEMKRTYELQRDDIVKAREKVMATDQNESDDDEEPDEVPVTALAEVKSLWPFLFKSPALSLHHEQLTGRNLHLSLDAFIEGGAMETALMYMTTCSNSNTANLGVRLKLDSNESLRTESNKFLALVLMASNHFKEDNTALLRHAEKTTLLSELDLSNVADVCIIALDQSAFAARKFVVCADHTVLVEGESFLEALISLIEICFVFDLEYPSIPRTFEFIER